MQWVDGANGGQGMDGMDGISVVERNGMSGENTKEWNESTLDE